MTRSHSTGSLLFHGALAVCLTVVLHRVLRLTLAEQVIVAKLLSSGWVAWAIGVLTLWSGLILLSRSLRLRREREALQLDLLPVRIAPQIHRQGAMQLSMHLYFRHGMSDLIVLRWLNDALQQIGDGQGRQEVIENLRGLAGREAAQNSAGYVMVRSFVWAVPILGFIGTVIGIGDAIGGFGRSLQTASEVAEIKSQLNHIVTGLSFAFDTTLVGLVAALLIVIPMGMIQRAEAALMREVDMYCQEQLVKRIP